MIENNVTSWSKEKTNLSETILDLNFKNKNVDLVKTVLTKVEMNERDQLISIGRKKLKESTLSKLISNFIFEAVELSIDMPTIKNVTSNINTLANDNVNLAVGLLSASSINDLVINVAPSAKNSTISLTPSLTFEGIGNMFKKNKRVEKGNDVLNYIYNDYIKDYLVIVSAYNNGTLTFGSYQKVDGKLKPVTLSSKAEFFSTNNMMITEIIQEIIAAKSSKIEFNRNTFKALLPQLSSLLSKNGYYESPNESDSKWIVFEDGIEPIKEMEDWDFHLDGEEELETAGELSPMSITKEKRPNSGMNESIKVKKNKRVSEDMSPQDSKDVTSALGILSNELVTNPTAKNDPTASALNKLTPNEKDALRKTAPQSMANSPDLGNLVQNVGKELSSKGDTISKDLQGTNKNKEVIKPFGTEQNTDPNTNSVND